MVIKYHISPYPTLMEDMVVKIWEASDDGPGSEVYTQNIPQAGGGGHPLPTTVIANGMDRVVHIIRLYTAVSNIKLHEYNEEPRIDLVEIFDPIMFKIGDGNPLTPAAGTDTYTDPSLIGLADNEFLVHRNNYGYLVPVLHYANTPVTGGFQLLNGDLFNNEEEFMVQRLAKGIETTGNDPVVGKWFAGYVDVPATTAMVFDPTHLRKLIRMEGVCSYSFNVNPPSNYAFCFQAYNGTGPGVNVVATIFFNNAPVKFNGVMEPTLTLKDNQSMAVVYDAIGGFWNVIYLSDSSFFIAAGGGGFAPLQTVQAGRTAINLGGGYPLGDLPPGDILVSVLHGMNIVGDYLVFTSLEVIPTGATPAVDNTGASNKVTHAWCHHASNKANEFYVTLQELTSEVQKLSIAWVIIKL